MSEKSPAWNLIDRAMKMMQMAGYSISPHNSDHNNPIIAWMADARSYLAASESQALAPVDEAKVRRDALEDAARICELCGYDSIQGAADIRALIGRGAGDGWVRCGERLPENDSLVLIAYNAAYRPRRHGCARRWSIIMARYAGNEWRFLTSKQKNRLIERVTHWRPLPPAPGDEGAKDG